MSEITKKGRLMFKEVLKIPKIKDVLYDKMVDFMANLILEDEEFSKALIYQLESCESPEELNVFIEEFVARMMSINLNDELTQEDIDILQNYLDNSKDEEL